MTTCHADTEDGDRCQNDAGDHTYCQIHRWVTFVVVDKSVAREDATGETIDSRSGEGIERRSVVANLNGCEITGVATDPHADEPEAGDDAEE